MIRINGTEIVEVLDEWALQWPDEQEPTIFDSAHDAHWAVEMVRDFESDNDVPVLKHRKVYVTRWVEQVI